MLFSVC
jgi:hypothetical protein